MIADTIETSKEEIEPILDKAFELMRAALMQGATVTLPGIGNIQTYVGKATRTKDPYTDEIVNVPPRRRVRYTPARKLVEDVRELNV